MPENFWLKLDEAVRIRTEHILAESIQSGQYDISNDRCSSGALGTWANSLLGYFLSKDDILFSLLLKLKSGNILEQDYVFQFFFNTIFRLLEDNDWAEYACSVILQGLSDGDIRFYNAIKSIMWSKDNSFEEKFRDAYDNFHEKTLTQEPEDDVPF